MSLVGQGERSKVKGEVPITGSGIKGVSRNKTTGRREERQKKSGKGERGRNH